MLDIRTPAGRRTGVLTARRLAIAFFVVSAGSYAVAKLIISPSHFVDLNIYRLEGGAVRDGSDLYGPLPGTHLLATYPPFAALVFVPLTFVPLGLLTTLVMLANFAALVWICVKTCRLFGQPRERAVTAALVFAAIAVWCEPVAWTLHYGQVNLFLLALVLWDFTRSSDSRWRGVGIGLAAALKVTPGIFIVYLLLTRRFAHAARAVAVFAAAIAVSALVAPGTTYRFWTHHLFASDRVGRVENAANHSMKGLLTRLLHTRELPPAALLVIAIVGLLGVVASVLAYRTLGDRWGVPAIAVTGLLVSPISWDHHWVWCVPIAILLWYRARWMVPIAVAIFSSYVIWRVPHAEFGTLELHLNWWQLCMSAVYVAFGIAFLGLVVQRSRAREERASVA